ncbi:hypothetical protein [Hyalangium rubrum]|uniref:Uncharacterized protein n=1 Tax=Hyalangium rubrum TaxID=3103134 RepID=A0ABU5HG55_9BACT|nr:hypothetical protein [Hyalangium sp. s54d21]MDY7231792.1 hypothetical protein [Hyalangium sp. s54d21]
MRRVLALWLATSLYAGAALAGEQKPPAPPPPTRAPEPAPAQGADKPELSAEDQEVVENLELLESLDEAEDFELLLELSREE